MSYFEDSSTLEIVLRLHRLTQIIVFFYSRPAWIYLTL